MKLFRKLEGSTYLTWSTEYCTLLRRIASKCTAVETTIQNLFPGTPYGNSYAPVGVIEKDVWDVACEISDELMQIKLPSGLLLFRNLVFDGFEQRAVHGLFSVLAHRIRQLSAPSSYALHSPVQSLAVDSGFPVHADLFGPRMLFNIVTQQCRGGDITILSAEELFSIMKRNRLMPNKVRDEIEYAFTTNYNQDSFDYVFDLMYGRHAWCPWLRTEISKRQRIVAGEIGTGYLMFDGKWLHGRTPVAGRLPEHRIQRLVFDTNSTMKKALGFSKSIPAAGFRESPDQLRKARHVKSLKIQRKAVSSLA